MLAQRESVIDFTIPYYEMVGLTILLKRPAQSTNLFDFTIVMTWQVWLLTAGAFVVTVLTLYVFDKFRCTYSTWTIGVLC